MDIWMQELRHTVRQLTKSPGYAVAAILTLGLGIGGVSAVYSVADAVLFKPLPYTAPEQLDLVRISLGEARRLASLSDAELLDLREQSRGYHDFAAFWSGHSLLTVAGEAHRVSWGWATANLLPMLGIDPMLGRHFEEADEDPNAPPVVLLSHHVWRKHFGGDPGVVGQTIDLGTSPRTVVGILPDGFQVLVRKTTGFHQPPDFWIPNTYWGDRDAHWLRVIGRRHAGTSSEQAQAEMDAIAARLMQEHSEYASTHLSFHAIPLQEDLVGRTRPALHVLLAAVAFLLLLACANVAGMSLARAGRRGGEIAVRAALGANRWRLVRQMLTENAVLALLGGGLGLLLAGWGVRMLAILRPSQLPRLGEIAIDIRVITVTALVTLLTLFASGLAAAWHASRPDLRASLHHAGRALSGRHRERTLKFFVVTEVAVALTLLIGAGLMVRSFQALRQVDLGFVPDQVLTLRLALNRTYDSEEKRWNFFARALDEVSALPGVERAGGISKLPFTGGFLTGHYAWDAVTAASFGQHEAEYRFVWPGFMETMGARLVASVSDVMGGERFVLVLMTLFAAIAVVLAALGLQAVVTFWVAERVPSIGLRLAIGARQGDILTLVLRHGLWLALSGVAVGVIASWMLTRALESQLFGVSSTDPAVFVGLASLLVTVALLACAVPAWRASRLDPVETLRSE